MRQLALKVPFISTLPAQREIKVEPHLSFVVGDSRFDSSVQGTPFAQTGKGDATKSAASGAAKSDAPAAAKAAD